MEPSLAARAAFFIATDTPFLRNTMIACSRSPLASVRAALQSIMGAPVFSRRSLTCAAEMFAIVVLIRTSGFKVSRFQSFKDASAGGPIVGGPIRGPIKGLIKVATLETLQPSILETCV